MQNGVNTLAPASLTNSSGRPWYREALVWWLAVIAVAIYLPRLTTLTIRGEESRRAVIAREMMETGDWIVPRTQGVVRLSRPPLQNWMIAATALATGGMSSWAVRLPGFFCTLATVILIYWYSRRHLQPFAAFLAGLAYASTLQVLEQGRTGETEPVFTLFMAASLMLWHGGRDRGWSPLVYWSVGGAFAALATLAKGLQAPIYFFASTWFYLIVSGQWRCLLTAGHAMGLVAFTAVMAAWQVPYTLMMGWHDTYMIYFWNVANRFHDKRTSTFLLHLVTYPPSVLLGCLAPWSILFLAYLDRDVRRQIGPRRDLLIFLVASIAICFPSVWLPPEARPRYFMPLFPCFAVLVGLTLELMSEVRNSGAQRLWNFFIRSSSLAMWAAAIGLTVWALIGSGISTPPLATTLVYGLLVATLGVMVWNNGTSLVPRKMVYGGLALTLFLGLSYVGPMITYQAQRSERLPEMVAELKQQLPPETELVSFDHVHHVFLHYLGETVDLQPWPTSLSDVPESAEYFCLQAPGDVQPQLPFAWEQVASLSVDRNRHAVPAERIIVGRIVESPSSGQIQQTSASELTTPR